MLRRPLVLLAALSIGLSACGTSGPEPVAEAPIATTAVRPSVSTARVVPSLTTSPTTPASTIPADPFETEVAHILEEIPRLEAYQEPDGEPAVFEFAVTNPTFFGNRLTLMITDRSEDGRWLEVQVPVRPNGTTAWIRADDAEVTAHRFRAEVDLTARSVTVWEGEDLVAQTAAVIGKDTSPTPLGRFFVNDLVEKWEGSAYGPRVLSLSGFSEALETFGGGVPVIAIHGTNQPELMGGAHSNGCVRIPNDVIAMLAETVPMGTPVDIVA